MTHLHLVDDDPPEPTLEQRLAAAGASYWEAFTIAEATRVRVRRLALDAIDAGMTSRQVAAATGISRITIDAWRRGGGARPNGGVRG